MNGSGSSTATEVSEKSTTPGWMLALAWLVVGIPLAFGVEQTVMKSLDLFRHSGSPPAATVQDSGSPQGHK